MQRFLHICFSPQKTKKLLIMKICFALTNTGVVSWLATFLSAGLLPVYLCHLNK